MTKIHRSIIYLFTIIFLLSGSLAASKIPVYNLKVKVNPETLSLEGRADIELPENMDITLDVRFLKIKELKIDGKKENYDGGPSVIIGNGKRPRRVEINYMAAATHRNKPKGHGAGDGAGGYTGITFLSKWYPAPHVISRFNLQVEIPADYEAISESDHTETQIKDNIKTIRYSFPYPVPGITLIAGKYSVKEDMYKKINLRTYFFSDDHSLSRTYLDLAKKYIKMHEEMIGDFPYKSFSIVENMEQTGYSFPTYTLLGSRVLKMPFVMEISLGHEILHQWLGNHVYNAPVGGNWAEGLTAYLSDHWYRQLKGEGSDHRKKLLVDYANYAEGKNEITVEGFAGKKGSAADAVGYGKSAMIFHMLRKNIGSDDFFSGIRRLVSDKKFQYAGWGDVVSVFSRNDKKTGAFFEQWIGRKGAVSFKLHDFTVAYRNGRYLLKFSIEQEGDIYNFNLPLRVATDSGHEDFLVNVDKKKIYVEKAFTGRPVKVIADEYYDLMRKLDESEKPHVISSITGDRNATVIALDNNDEAHGYATGYMMGLGYKVKYEKNAGNSDLKDGPVVVLSGQNKIYRRLFGEWKPSDAGVAVEVMENPLNRSRSVMLIHGKSMAEMKSAMPKIMRYGNYSKIYFSGGENTGKEIGESARGIVRELYSGANVVETSKILGIGDLAEKIRDRDVVYVGENHNIYSHHVMQLEIIKNLYGLKGNLIIGMEMFQQPFQKYLDQYINGEISEREFLKGSEYFNRWNFDYNLYRDILHFARAKKIPVIALNIREEILKKVSRQGIDSLSPDEYSQIPNDMDMTNSIYMESMLKVLKAHSGGHSGIQNFDNFFQSQILWDETMAHNTVEALKKYPGRTIVVLAGNGHIRYSWGIPDRVKRLSGAKQTVIINDAGPEVDRGVADFILFPAAVEGPVSPRLQVYLREDREGLYVVDVLKDGPALKAGILKSDIILSINDRELKDIADLKIFLIDFKPGDVIRLKVKRRTAFYFIKELVIDVKL